MKGFIPKRLKLTKTADRASMNFDNYTYQVITATETYENLELPNKYYDKDS